MSIKADIISPDAPLFKDFFLRFKCESCGRIIENKDSADLCKGLKFKSFYCPNCGGKLKKIKMDVPKDLRKIY